MPKIEIQTKMTLTESFQKSENTTASNSNIQVQLSLDTGTKALWTREKYPRKIDIISAHFDKEVHADKKGNISLSISLLNGAKFVKPYLTRKKQPTGNIPHIHLRSDLDNTALEVKFEQLSKGHEPIDYDDLLFHTTSGTIDPGIRITRL